MIGLFNRWVEARIAKALERRDAARTHQLMDALNDLLPSAEVVELHSWTPHGPQPLRPRPRPANDHQPLPPTPAA